MRNNKAPVHLHLWGCWDRLTWRGLPGTPRSVGPELLRPVLSLWSPKLPVFEHTWTGLRAAMLLEEIIVSATAGQVFSASAHMHLRVKEAWGSGKSSAPGVRQICV